jgi:hypothetical protein
VADLTVVDEDWQVEATLVDGAVAYRRDSVPDAEARLV